MNLFESSTLKEEPLIRVKKWIEEAINMGVPLPHAMNLSTVSESGQPSSRVVLLKGISDSGLVFYTDYESKKGHELIKNPKAALNFWWARTNKQIRIQGACVKIPQQEADKYFQTRPRGSQISATVSLQSREIKSYEYLVREAENLENKSSGDYLKRPDRWGGYLLIPDKVEFWKDETNRLHKRELFTLVSGTWKKILLSP